MDNRVLVWDRHRNVAGVNRVLGSQSFPFDNWFSIGNADI